MTIVMAMLMECRCLLCFALSLCTANQMYGLWSVQAACNCGGLFTVVQYVIFVVCLLPGGRYLVQRVIPMLPRLLCEQLCSLQPGDPRFAFSIVWEMDEDGHIYRFGSYAHVLSMGAVRGLPPHLLHATPTILSCSRRSNKQCLCMVTSLKRQ